MTTESDQTQWSVAGLLELFDVQPNGRDRFTAETGIAGADERQVVEGTQVLAQAVVAAAKRFADKSVRSAQAVTSTPSARCATTALCATRCWTHTRSCSG